MTKIKKPKIKTPAQLKDELWELCKKIVRQRYVLPSGNWNCFTCGRLIDEPAKAHTAHFIPSASCGAFLRHDLRNLRVCCYYCNINLGGNGAVYYRNLVKENGQKFVDQIFQDKNKVIKADVIWYMSLIEKYKKILHSEG